MPSTLNYVDVDGRTIQLAIRSSDGKWLNWTASAAGTPVFESPFAAANHLLATTPDATFSTIQAASIASNLLIDGATLVEFAAGQPVSVLNTPSNYVEPVPSHGVVILQSR